jgi:hypothetical protein
MGAATDEGIHLDDAVELAGHCCTSDAVGHTNAPCTSRSGGMGLI